MKEIFLDLDMTLNSMSYDWCTSLGIKPKDVLYYGWIRDALGLEAEAWWAQPGIYNVITPLPGSQPFVQYLANHFKVNIITHTHSNQNPKEKELWIDKYFGYSIARVIHAHEKFHHTVGSILVDDCPRHIYDHIRTNCSPGILFNHRNDYGWSRPLVTDNENLIVASSYQEIIENVTAMCNL